MNTSLNVLLVGHQSMGAMLANNRDLDPARFSIATARDGADALTQIRRSRPDVIVVDSTAPGFSPGDIPARCRAEGLDDTPPIVALSNRNQLRDVVAGEGVWVCLVNPVQPEVLIGAVERIADFCYARELS